MKKSTKIYCFLLALVVTSLILFFIGRKAAFGAGYDSGEVIYATVQCNYGEMAIPLEAGNFRQNLDSIEIFKKENGRYCSDEAVVSAPLSKSIGRGGPLLFYLNGKIGLSENFNPKKNNYNHRHLTYFWELYDLFKADGWRIGEGNYIGDVNLSHVFLEKQKDWAARATVKINRKPVFRKNFKEEETSTKKFCPTVVKAVKEGIYK